MNYISDTQYYHYHHHHHRRRHHRKLDRVGSTPALYSEFLGSKVGTETSKSRDS